MMLKRERRFLLDLERAYRRRLRLTRESAPERVVIDSRPEAYARAIIQCSTVMKWRDSDRG